MFSAGIASGSMMNSGPPSYSSTMGRGYDFNSNTSSSNNEFSSGPLSHLSESVNSLDPLNAMEKSLNEQVSYTLIQTQLFFVRLQFWVRSFFSGLRVAILNGSKYKKNIFFKLCFRTWRKRSGDFHLHLNLFPFLLVFLLSNFWLVFGCLSHEL